jgi:hypothetical protein
MVTYPGRTIGRAKLIPTKFRHPQFWLFCDQLSGSSARLCNVYAFSTSFRCDFVDWIVQLCAPNRLECRIVCFTISCAIRCCPAWKIITHTFFILAEFPVHASKTPSVVVLGSSTPSCSRLTWKLAITNLVKCGWNARRTRADLRSGKGEPDAIVYIIVS